MAHRGFRVFEVFSASDLKEQLDRFMFNQESEMEGQCFNILAMSQSESRRAKDDTPVIRLTMFYELSPAPHGVGCRTDIFRENV